MSALGQLVETQVSRVDGAMSLAARHLLGLQKAEGFWWGDLTADTTLESDFILMELWLYPPAEGQAQWDPPTRSRIDKACRRILSQQLPDGGFNIYAGGPADVSATTKAYFALKASGYGVDDPCMRAARERILALGGFQACNSYVKLNLSFFGLYPRQFVPSIPPEMMLVPGGWLYEMSSWSRAIVVPLSVVHASNPRRPVPEGFHLEELFRPDIPLSFPKAANLISWRNFFYGVDAGLKLWDRFGSARLRKMGVERAMAWALERTQQSDGLGAIYPAMMYMIMALDLMGYSRESEEFREALGQFERLKVETDDDLFPALLLAGLGYRHRRLRSCRFRARFARIAERRRGLAADERGPPERRLEREAAGYRTLGMVFRIRERVLSGYRRYRHGADGACPHEGQRPGRTARVHRPGRELAARHAIERRRLGGVRRR